MNSKIDFFAIEEERYELREQPLYNFSLPRRDFLKQLGGGVVVLLLVANSDAQESGRRGGGGRGGNQPQELSAWIHIAEDGKITAYTGKVEVGQNTRTALAQAVADELSVAVDAVTMVMGDTDRVPFDAGTFGSQSTPRMMPQLRKAAASAREVLVDLAAESLKVQRAELTLRDGSIVHPQSNRNLTYGALTKGQKLTRTVTADARTIPAKEWKAAGVSAHKQNAAAYVTGAHQYTTDIRLPGMVFGRVLRAPSIGAKLISADLTAAKALEGVTAVQDGNFVGVTAKTQFAAAQALEAIKAEWETTPQVGQKELFDHFKKTANNGNRNEQREKQVADALSNAAVKLEARYTVDYIAHAPLEPRAAVAEWKDNRLTVWTGTQRPFGVRSELARAFNISEDAVRVIVPDTGSGYGGKHTGEAAIEAARLARGAKAPVKLIWSRAEEFHWAYFRPAGLIEVRSGATADGKLSAWEFYNYNSGGSSVDGLYEIPAKIAAFRGADSPLRQGSYRALASTANHFARESHMDELAHALKIDRFTFRMNNLKDERLRAVLQAARSAIGKHKAAAGVGMGIACGFEKSSYVATAVLVRPNERGGIELLHVVTAYECGAIVNPEHLKSQVEGAVVQGIGGALFESIRFENGKILNGRLAQYRVPRFQDLPQMETILLNRTDLQSVGAGETPIVAIAPAIANAWFAATGKRLRSLPLNSAQA